MSPSKAPSTPPPTLRRRGATIAALLAVVLGLLTLRVVLSSRQALHEAVSLHAAGDVDEAIVHYRRAARWYAPGNPYSSEAIAHLEGIALQAEREAKRERALRAWRAIRAALLSARSFYTPHSDLLRRADARIAHHMTSASTFDPRAPAVAKEASRENQLESLRNAATRRSVGWPLVALIGFVTWVGGAIGFSIRAIDEDERLILPQARRWASLVLGGLSLFALGLWLA